MLSDEKIENAIESEPARDRELREAIERVYRVYGADISAFARTIEEELHKRSTPRSEVTA